MAYIVQRVFGRAKDGQKIEDFFDWFADNADRMENTLDDENPHNGQFTLDYQFKTQSFIVEVQTLDEEFANDILNKFEELEFDDSKKIGDVR
jgi:hypothetical protein